MKPRQIKKNSRNAMELLIKFGYNKRNFEFCPDGNNEYIYYTDACCGDFWDTTAIKELEDLYKYSGAKIVKDSSGYDSLLYKRKPLYGVALISECRKLIKAGVKFK